jgi:hypothetical protein
MKNNVLGKKCLSCSFSLYGFRKYVSYGFPIINFCNPGVHYETPCIMFFITVKHNTEINYPDYRMSLLDIVSDYMFRPSSGHHQVCIELVV